MFPEVQPSDQTAKITYDRPRHSPQWNWAFPQFIRFGSFLGFLLLLSMGNRSFLLFSWRKKKFSLPCFTNAQILSAGVTAEVQGVWSSVEPKEWTWRASTLSVATVLCTWTNFSLTASKCIASLRSSLLPVAQCDRIMKVEELLKLTPPCPVKFKFVQHHDWDSVALVHHVLLSVFWFLTV